MGKLTPNAQCEHGNSLFFFSLFSHVMVPSIPVEMAAETAAVACSENSEGWESSFSFHNSHYFLFPLSVFLVPGPRAGRIIEVCDQAGYLKPQHSC